MFKKKQNCAKKHPLMEIWPQETVPQTSSRYPGRALDQDEGIWRDPRNSQGRRYCLDFVFLTFFFWPRHTAYGILVPRPGIEPRPSAVRVRSPNHWTAGEVPLSRCTQFPNSTDWSLQLSQHHYLRPESGCQNLLFSHFPRYWGLLVIQGSDSTPSPKTLVASCQQRLTSSFRNAPLPPGLPHTLRPPPLLGLGQRNQRGCSLAKNPET